MNAPVKKPLMDPSTQHRLELMIIILVVTVIGNILIFWLNKRYEENQLKKVNNSQEIRKQPGQ